MKILILTFSANKVNEDSLIPNKMGLTHACMHECVNELNNIKIESEHICVNNMNIQKCLACGTRGWGTCLDSHKCVLSDDFNDLYTKMNDYDAYIFITPVYFWEMSESAKTFFDRLKRCDAFNDNSKIKNKNIMCIACAGGSGNGTKETLQNFEYLSHFLKTNIVASIPMTKYNFNENKDTIYNGIKNLIGVKA